MTFLSLKIRLTRKKGALMMPLSIGITILIIIVLLAFLAEYIDSTFGMGYGTTLTPILLIIGFAPLEIVPAILLSEFITGLLAATLHNVAGNVNFDFSNDFENLILRRLQKLGYLQGLGYLPKSRDSKVAFIISLCSVFGVVIAVLVAIKLPTFYLKLYISLLVLFMGILILITRRKTPHFSWIKISGLGVFASFNKGISGGGYGPVVTSGQILSGMESKNSVAITSFSESLTCLVGVLFYFINGIAVNWELAPYLAMGAILSVPFSVFSVKKISSNYLTKIIGVTTMLLGLFSVFKLL